MTADIAGCRDENGLGFGMPSRKLPRLPAALVDLIVALPSRRGSQMAGVRRTYEDCLFAPREATICHVKGENS